MSSTSPSRSTISTPPNDFYLALGCHLARRYDDRITLDFFGDQLVCHLSDQRRPDDPQLYPRHFGVTFRRREDFDNLLFLVETRDLPVFHPAQPRFKDTGRGAPHRRAPGPVQQPDRVQALPRPTDDALSMLIVVRHGQTALERQPVASRATPTRRSIPSVATRRERRRWRWRCYRPARIVASDLRRARQTAEIDRRELSVVDVALDPRLREVALGDLAGSRPPECGAVRFPDEYAAWAGGEDVRRGGGETEAEAGRGSAAVLGELAWATAPSSPSPTASRCGPDCGSSRRTQAAHLRNGRWAVVAAGR